MKKLSLLLFSAFIVLTANAQYNADRYAEKPFYAFKQDYKPQKWSGFITMQGGFSPTFPDVFLGASLGLTQRFGQISVSALPALNSQSLIIYNAMLGYRFPINQRFTVVPKAGGWVYTRDDTGNKFFSPGNHLCYGLEFNMRVEGHLEFTIEGVDYRGQGIGFDGRKILTTGIRYIL